MQPWNQLYRELKRYKEEGEVARKNGPGKTMRERERERTIHRFSKRASIYLGSPRRLGFSPPINGFSFADPLFSGLLVKQ